MKKARRRDVTTRARRPARRTILQAGAAFGLSVLVASRADAASDLTTLLADLAHARAKLKTLVAPFRQARTIGLLASRIDSAGQMTLVRPDRLRWELFPPDSAVYWVLPEGIAYRTGTSSGRLQAEMAGTFGGVLSDLMLLLGGDLASLGTRYDLARLAKEGGPTIEARPKRPELAKLVRRIELELSDDLHVAKTGRFRRK